MLSSLDVMIKLFNAFIVMCEDDQSFDVTNKLHAISLECTILAF